VITINAVKVSEIQSGDSRFLEDLQVSAVRHQAIDLVSDGVSVRVRRGCGKLIDEPRVVVARLKHDRRTTRAACFEVKSKRDLLRERMLKKCLGPEQSCFFTIAKQEDQVVS
jgi:hypothetical protein